MGKPSCRIGHADLVHCSTPHRAEGSPTVFLEGIPWSRLTDHNDGHLKPSGDTCVVHTAPIRAASDSVFIDTLSAGRIADPTCTAVAEGLDTVITGP